MARPFLLFFAGRLYIWSLGIAAVVVNGLLFLALAYLSPDPLAMPGGQIFSAALGTLLMGLLATFLEVVTGLDSPRRDTEVRTTPRYWRWLSFLPGSRNRAVEGLRMVQLVSTARSYALEILTARTPIAPVRRFFKRLLPHQAAPRRTRSRRHARLMLQELGPTFVKFGQLVASRGRCCRPIGAVS